MTAPPSSWTCCSPRSARRIERSGSRRRAISLRSKSDCLPLPLRASHLPRISPLPHAGEGKSRAAPQSTSPIGTARHARRVRKYRRAPLDSRAAPPIYHQLPTRRPNLSVQSTSPEVALEPTAHRIQTEPSATEAAMQTAFPILAMLSVCHLLNDMIQSLLPAIYPLLKTSFKLDFGQIGLITLTFQVTASLLQPLVGIYTDR